MSLPDGGRIGPYAVIAPLGEGGMGRVYRARDARLGRDVAIKVLPEHFAGDPDRLARFEREAQLLAALSHPNIAAIHGVEDVPGSKALVLELVEGSTLADRIAVGPLAMDEALPMARQIADALEAAHEQGIVHRDLKPANIKVRPDGVVKVLDFGLAKALDPATSQPSSNLPTLTSPAMTAMGMILGTAAYMSPEQARGKPVDRRTDIWAFGCVLYEMLTGRRAFDGEDVSLTLSQVLQREPDWAAIPSAVDRRVVYLLRRCLEKDQRRRLRDIGEARVLLEGGHSDITPVAEQAAAPASRRWHARMPWIAAGTTVAALAGLAIWILLRPAPEQAIVRWQYHLPSDLRFSRSGRHLLTLSPDGTNLVYVANERLWLRPFDALAATPLTDPNEDPIEPVFSPDGRWVAYCARSTSGSSGTKPYLLKKIAVTGGAPVTLASIDDAPHGASWRHGRIVLAQNVPAARGLFTVPESGGAPELLLPASETEWLRQPRFLDDERNLLFVVGKRIAASNDDDIVVQSLDTGARTVLVRGGMDPRVTAFGQLLFLRGDALLSLAFDARRLAAAGDPVQLLDNVRWSLTSGPGQYALSETGTLAYVPALGPHADQTPVWVNRDGAEAGPVFADSVPESQFPRLSPDEARLAIVREGDLWVYPLDGRAPNRLTFAGTGIGSPLWTPDGRRILYEAGAAEIQSVLASGEGLPTQVLAGHYHPHGWSAPDGSEMLIVDGAARDVLTVRLEPAAPLRPIVQTPANEGFAGASLSPDGRWLAYTSDQTGEPEIWVRPFPGPGAAERISRNGGDEPVWARNGRELFYREGNALMAVAVETASLNFRFAPAVRRFTRQYFRSSQPPSYDVGSDGRFIFIRSGDVEGAGIIIIQNWHTDAARRMTGR